MKTTSLILTALMFLHTILAFAQAGSLDNSFSYNGKVNNPAGSAHALVGGDRPTYGEGTHERRWSDRCVLNGLVRWLAARRSATPSPLPPQRLDRTA